MIQQRLDDVYNFLKLRDIQETKKLLDIVLNKLRYVNVNPIELE
jgi:hypothetical protein